MAKSRHECMLNTEFALDILSNAGFYIHYEKSVLQPTQRLTFLGFVIDSKDMSIYLPDSKIDKLKSCVHELLSCSSVTVERLSQVIGFLVSCLPAFTYGKLHYITDRWRCKRLNHCAMEAIKLRLCYRQSLGLIFYGGRTMLTSREILLNLLSSQLNFELMHQCKVMELSAMIRLSEVVGLKQRPQY